MVAYRSSRENCSRENCSRVVQLAPGETPNDILAHSFVVIFLRFAGSSLPSTKVPCSEVKTLID